MSEELGTAIYLIATGVARSPKYSQYTYLDEMVSDGIENCIQYLHNFNPEKSKNAFGYLTQIIIYAFWRRIKKEKKQAAIKYKCFEEAGVSGLYDAVKHRDSLHEQDPQRKFIDHLQISATDIEKINQENESKPTAKKKKKRGLEKFID
jgi:hypothetical protein